MKDVICQIINEEQNDPRPPRVGRELKWRQVVTKEIDVTRNKSPQERPSAARKPQQDISFGISQVREFVAPVVPGPMCLNRDQDRKERNCNDRWAQHKLELIRLY